MLIKPPQLITAGHTAEMHWYSYCRVCAQRRVCLEADILTGSPVHLERRSLVVYLVCCLEEPQQGVTSLILTPRSLNIPDLIVVIQS